MAKKTPHPASPPAESDTTADLEALRDLNDAVRRWGSELERSWRFPGRAADDALVRTHAELEKHYARLSADFLAQHPELEEEHARAKLSDDPRGDLAGRFSGAVMALCERLQST